MKQIDLSDGWHLLIFSSGEIHLCRTIDETHFAVVLGYSNLPNPLTLEGGINMVRTGGLTQGSPN